MKYLILFIVLISCCLSNDKLEKLENTYINKANQLKAIRDKVVLEADTKLQNDSRRLADAYIKALKKEQIAIVKTGDLEAALKIKAKIIEIENIIKLQILRSKVVDVNAIKGTLTKKTQTISLNPVVGLYTNCVDNGKLNNWHVRVNSNGTFDIIFLKSSSKNYSGKWKKKNDIYTFTYPHPSSYSTLTLKNGSLIGKHYYKGKINQPNRLWTGKKQNIDVSKHFYTKETITNTTWIAYDATGKKTGVELTLLAGGKFNVINAPWFKSYWKWGFKDGCIIYGASTVNGCKVDFSKDGQQAIKFYNIGRKESYPGKWALKK